MRHILIASIVAAIMATSVAAADWKTAGGGLFVGRPVVSEESATAAETKSPDAAVPAPIEPYAEAIDAAARAHGLDPKLLHALVIVESSYRAHAHSAAGAQGLSQLMPGTATENGVVDAYDPRSNLEGGARYLATQINRFRDLRLALAAYNAGPARVQIGGRMPDIPETEAYVDDVVNCYLALAAGRSPRSGIGCRPRRGQ